MLSKQCRITRQEIDELELGARPGEQAMSHLQTCEGCREFRAERTMLRDITGSLEPVVAPADFDMRLRARIAAERSSRVPRPFFARLVSTPSLATAALFVAVAGLAVWIAQRQPSSTIPINPAVTATNSGPAKATSATDGQVSTGPVGTALTDGGEMIADKGRNPIRRPRPSRSPRAEDFAVMPANQIRQDDRAYVPSRPVEFSVQDARGNTRRISLPAVSFGAQSLVDNRTAVSYSSKSRVW